MHNLYENFADIYEMMYHTFIDYEAEFAFYEEIIGIYNKLSVLEVGCGTGNLAQKFAEKGYEYTGLDISPNMLDIATKKAPQCRFVLADMRNFHLERAVHAVIITARTISHLTESRDVMASFEHIGKNMLPKGILSFDCIDATKFIPSIFAGKTLSHHTQNEDKQFRRDSFWLFNPNNGWCFDWKAWYYQVTTEGQEIYIGDDFSTVRTFTKEEISLFLRLAGFEVVEIIDRPSYAFETFVVIAQKNYV